MSSEITEREPVPRLPPPARRRALRELYGVTQTELAAILGVTTRSVSRWESGANPTGPNLFRYSAILTRWAERSKQRRG
jgi:DNA-binding transcriptional regulator YiaG